MENKNEKEIDPEIALAASGAEIEIEEKEIESEEDNNDENEEEIVIENEPMEGGEKNILRGTRKKKKYNKKQYNNNNNDKYYNNSNTKAPLKKKVIKKKDLIYDPNFDIESNYFYQTISQTEWDEIKSFLIKCFQGQTPSESFLQNFFSSHPKLKKGNIEKLQSLLDSISSGKNNFITYQKIMQYFLKEYYKPKPSICEVYFFPNAKNEKYLVDMLRTCKISLNIAIFSITRDNFAKAIIEVFNKGVKVRVIADDECVKNYGSDIYKLAAKGIPCKTDNSQQFHMHNKYAIIDESVVITGSFNWTTQAINNNQENLLFYEDKELADKYLKEFNKLWNDFNTVIDKENAIKQVELEKEKNKK